MCNISPDRRICSSLIIYAPAAVLSDIHECIWVVLYITCRSWLCRGSWGKMQIQVIITESPEALILCLTT